MELSSGLSKTIKEELGVSGFSNTYRSIVKHSVSIYEDDNIVILFGSRNIRGNEYKTIEFMSLKDKSFGSKKSMVIKLKDRLNGLYFFPNSINYFKNNSKKELGNLYKVTL